MLLMGKKFSANEAQKCGLVTKVFPTKSFQKEAWARIHQMAELPIKVYKKNFIEYKKLSQVINDLMNTEFLSVDSIFQRTGTRPWTGNTSWSEQTRIGTTYRANAKWRLLECRKEILWGQNGKIENLKRERTSGRRISKWFVCDFFVNLE